MFTEVMPSNHRPTKHPPVYQEVNKNRNPNKKNQLTAQGDRGYINHPLNGTGKPYWCQHSAQSPEDSC